MKEENEHIRDFIGYNERLVKEGAARAVPHEETRLHDKADLVQSTIFAPELERKRPDVELEQLCNEVQVIIDKLSIMDQRSLTQEQQQKRRVSLQQALDVAEVLEVEQMVRLMRKLQSKVLYRLALSRQQKKRGGND